MLSITQKLIAETFLRPRRPLKELKGIVIHWTANRNEGAGAATHARYFNNLRPGGRQASAHYMVDDKAIIQIIPDMEVAFHVGAKAGRYTQFAKDNILEGSGDTANNYFIGIELCVNSDSDLQQTRKNGAELTRELLDKYNLSIDQVYTHHDITGKNCPQDIINCKDADDWRSFKQEVQAVRPPNTSANGMRLGSSGQAQTGTQIPFQPQPWNDMMNQIMPGI